MSRHSGLLTLGFASIAHSYSHLFILLYATVVLALEREWGLSYDVLFAVSIPSSIMFGLAALPAGWLGDRWSAAGMIAVFFLGVGGASVATGFAATPLQMGIGLFFIGSFAAIYHPVGIPWLVKHAVNRGRALGVNGVFGSLGTAAAAAVAGLLIDLYGWRSAFILPGLICLVTGLAFIVCLRRGLIEEAADDVVAQPAQSQTDRKRVFMILAVTVVCTGLIFQATSFALPKVFAERLTGLVGDGVFGIGGLVSACYLVSGFTQLIGGELADRYSLRRVYFAFQLAQLPVLAAAFVLISPALVPVAALMIAFNVMGQPAENSLLARYTPTAWRSRVFGAKFVLTLGVSAVGVALIPIVYALAGSLSPLFVALFGFAALAAVAAWVLPPDRDRDLRPALQAAE